MKLLHFLADISQVVVEIATEIIKDAMAEHVKLYHADKDYLGDVSAQSRAIGAAFKHHEARYHEPDLGTPQWRQLRSN